MLTLPLSEVRTNETLVSRHYSLTGIKRNLTNEVRWYHRKNRRLEFFYLQLTFQNKALSRLPTLTLTVTSQWTTCHHVALGEMVGVQVVQWCSRIEATHYKPNAPFYLDQLSFLVSSTIRSNTRALDHYITSLVGSNPSRTLGLSIELRSTE